MVERLRNICEEILLVKFRFKCIFKMLSFMNKNSKPIFYLNKAISIYLS